MRKQNLEIRGFFAISLAIFALFLSAQNIAQADDSLLADDGETCDTMTMCMGNFVPDSKDCGCVCGITSCSDPSEVFDSTTCTCKNPGAIVPPACAGLICQEGSLLDQQNCQCIAG